MKSVLRRRAVGYTGVLPVSKRRLLAAEAFFTSASTSPFRRRRIPVLDVGSVGLEGEASAPRSWRVSDKDMVDDS